MAKKAKKEEASKSIGVGLCIGLNSVSKVHYQGWDGKLNACENDANDMGKILKSNGFSEVITLLSKQATRLNFFNAFNKLTSKLKEGDTFIITYSGHGGQVPDKNKDEEDKLDETWCLYDKQLIDDELFFLLSKVKAGVNIVVFSDSCHSGTMIKSMHMPKDVKVKSVPFSVEREVYLANKSYYDKVTTLTQKQPTITANCILISGCQDNQYSLDGQHNGLFTGTLLRVYNNGKFTGSYKELHKQIVRSMPPTQTPNLCIINDYGLSSKHIFTV